jgi:hypothetical protein
MGPGGGEFSSAATIHQTILNIDKPPSGKCGIKTVGIISIDIVVHTVRAYIRSTAGMTSKQKVLTKILFYF